jgi:tetratricopeptide (TPR) repeat protein
MERVVRVYERAFGEDHPNVATALNNLAVLLQTTNRLAEAESLMRRALSIDERSFGKDHPKVATALNNLAQLLQAANRLAEAEPVMLRVVTIFEKSFGKDHPNVATALNNLAQLLQMTNRVAEAEPLERRALAIDERSLGEDHPSVARDLNNLASLMQLTHRLAEAEPLVRRALDIDERSFGPDHPEVAVDLHNLAALLESTKRCREAEPLLRRALAIVTASFGNDHPNCVVVRERLDRVRRILGSGDTHPYLERMLLKARQKDAVAGEDYRTASTCRDEIARLDRAHDYLSEFGQDAIRLLNRLAAMRSIALPVKRSVGGRVLREGDSPATMADLERGIEFAMDELEEFEDFQFAGLCAKLERIGEATDLFAALGIRQTAEKNDFGVGPDAWSIYARQCNTRADRVLYCLANRFVQTPPTKEDAFRVADIFDHFGQPFAASALRDRYRDELLE